MKFLLFSALFLLNAHAAEVLTGDRAQIPSDRSVPEAQSGAVTFACNCGNATVNGGVDRAVCYSNWQGPNGGPAGAQPRTKVTDASDVSPETPSTVAAKIGN